MPPAPRSRKAPPSTSSASAGKRTSKHVVDLPGGGQLELKSAEEVQVWDETRDNYLQDYGFSKTNDLVLLGAILSQVVIMFRAQNDLADPKQTIVASAQGRIQKAAEEIRDLEKALGIDKKTREAGGQHTTADYVTRLKRAGHGMGVHIHERVTAYEAVMMEARWKIRVLRNGDDEDRRHHHISAKTIIDWLEGELDVLEEKDQEWAKDKGRIFVGRL